MLKWGGQIKFFDERKNNTFRIMKNEIMLSDKQMAN
jgi:hypothetical protein